MIINLFLYKDILVKLNTVTVMMRKVYINEYQILYAVHACTRLTVGEKASLTEG